MKLDFFKELEKNIKNSEINDFLNQLSDYLNKTKEDIEDKIFNNDEKSFITINEIEKKYNLTFMSREKLNQSRDEILKKYLEKDIYWVKYKNKYKNTYIITKYDRSGKNEELYISEENLPKNIKEDMILKKENSKFVIDIETSNEMMDKIIENAKKISIEQNTKLDTLRKEGTLYQVVEGKRDYIYLQNTETNEIFEEVKFLDEVKRKIATDFVLRYENGNYVIDENLTEKFFNNMTEIKEYYKIQKDFLENSKIQEISPKAKFKILSKEEKSQYTTLYYEYDKEKTIKVPNVLLPFFTNDRTVLYYDYNEKNFKNDIKIMN